ncbi:hypothetical protein D3Z50_06200 [Clostridiaceae bacterium]|nr:hypothetical protein [Clostridiaceae bacterium]
MEEIILVGYGGHAKSMVDAIERSRQFHIAGYTDSRERDSEYVYLGTDEALENYLEKGIHNLALCIGYLGKGTIRERLYRNLKERGFSFPVIMDPSAVVSERAVIGEGTFIGKKAVINSEALIGKMCIINTAAVIEHECQVGDFSHISVGAVLCGQVRTGEAVFVGANATIIQCQEIEEREVVPAGMTVRSAGRKTG